VLSLSFLESEETYDGCCRNMRRRRVASRLPTTLIVSEKFAERLEAWPGHRAARIRKRDLWHGPSPDRWSPEKARAENCLRADERAASAVNYLHNTAGSDLLAVP